MFIATIAGATTLFQTSIDNISIKSNGKTFIQNLWNECINISKENGYELRPEAKNLYEDLLFKSDVPFKASMLVDMEKKLIDLSAVHYVENMNRYKEELMKV